MVSQGNISNEIRAEILRRSAGAATMCEVGSAVADALVDGQVQLNSVSLDEVKGLLCEAVKTANLSPADLSGREPC